jgi:pimeloyl-ACP methyl ester carboxylesterase
MLRHTLSLLTLAVISYWGSSLTAEQSMPLLGDWAARLDVNTRPTVLWLNVAETPARDFVASIRIDPSPTPAPVFVLRNIKIVGKESSWTLAGGDAPNLVRLDVRRNDAGFEATYSVGTATGRTQLRRAPSDATVNRPLQGTYVSPSGDNIYVRTASYGPYKVLSYLEEKTGRNGFLYQTATNSYVGGPSYVLPDPVAVTVTFEGNPPARLTWQSNGTKPVTAMKSRDYSREDVQIPVEGARLGCEVLTPAGAGKHPAVVLVPGSGAVDRFARYYIVAELFARHNVASLVCDKRGTGVSTGDWNLQSFEQQAQDIVGGMEYLRRRPDVDASRVGIWALSQGTFPGPIAALTGKSSFLILAAGFGISLREAVIVTNIERMKSRGTPSEEIARYRDYFERFQQAVLANDFKAYERVYQEYAGAAWLPNPLSEESWKSWGSGRARLMWASEHEPTLRKIRIPVLAFWGSEDREVLPHVHKPAMEQALREAGNVDYSLRVIAGAEHILLIDAPAIQNVGYAPEYISGMLEWLRAKVIRPARAAVSADRARRRIPAGAPPHAHQSRRRAAA